MTESKLTRRIRAAGDRKALIPFLPAGFPDLEGFWNALAELDAAGADVIEIGVPFSDPVADGPVVESASLSCLERGVCLEWILGELRKRRGNIGAEIVLMGYYNPFLQYGLTRLARDAAEAGVSGFIVPDLPLEESSEMRAALDEHGLDLVPLVGLNTNNERLRLYAEGARGFAYFVSVMGTTGAKLSGPEEIRGKLAAAQEAFDVPLALGFGISKPEDLADFGEHLDAVVFGSALIRHIREGKSAGSFMEAWRS
jgi:tryptophan synthase alpha chain